jgi:small ligand-binding sensory domain FIST
MSSFIAAHASHPDWQSALASAAAQVDAQLPQHDAGGGGPLTLGFVYVTSAYAAHAEALLAALRLRWPGVSWVGGVGIGVAASGVEYFDQPALVLMLSALPSGRFEVFSGVRPLSRIDVFSALVHVDPETPEIGELVDEMSDRTASGYLFGGVMSSITSSFHIADGVWRGGLSGVAFSADVALVSRVTQGCQPVGPVRRITRAERNIVLQLDGEPALPCLLRDIGAAGVADPRAVLPRLRDTLVGLSDATDTALGRGGQFGADVRVRGLVGIDPGRGAVAVGDLVQTDMRLAFCTRDVASARRDLVRICSEIREELAPAPALPPFDPALAAGGPDAWRALAAAVPPPAPPLPRRIHGAIYVSCAGRGGPHFGGPSAELQIVRHALGDVPLVGFFASGEIARHHVYGYTGVLTVFTDPA